MAKYDWLDEPFDEDLDESANEETEPASSTSFVYTYHVKTHVYISGFPEKPLDYTEVFIDMSMEGNIPRPPRAEELGEYIADLDHELLEQIGIDTGFPAEMLVPHHEIVPMF